MNCDLIHLSIELKNQSRLLIKTNIGQQLS